MDYFKILWDLIFRKSFSTLTMLKLMIYSNQGAPLTTSLQCFICYLTKVELFLSQIFCWLALFLEVWWAPFGGGPQSIALMPIESVRACKQHEWLNLCLILGANNFALNCKWSARSCQLTAVERLTFPHSITRDLLVACFIDALQRFC